MKKCNNCNNFVDDTAVFCPLCGGKIGDSSKEEYKESHLKKDANNSVKIDSRSVRKFIQTIKNVRFFVGHLIIIIASLTSAIVLITLSFNNLMLQHQEFASATGTVIEIKEKEVYSELYERNITEYYYVMSYKYNDKEYLYYMDEGVKNKGEIGDTFTLYFLVDHPEEAALESPEGLILVGKVVFGVGIGMSVICLINIFILSFKFVRASKSVCYY